MITMTGTPISHMMIAGMSLSLLGLSASRPGG